MVRVPRNSPIASAEVAQLLADDEILRAELGVSAAKAFRLLSRCSQNTDHRVRWVSARLVQGQIAAAEFRSRPDRDSAADPRQHPRFAI